MIVTGGYCAVPGAKWPCYKDNFILDLHTFTWSLLSPTHSPSSSNPHHPSRRKGPDFPLAFGDHSSVQFRGRLRTFGGVNQDDNYTVEDSYECTVLPSSSPILLT